MLLAAFAVVCLVMANLERITRCVDAVSARLQARRRPSAAPAPAAPARWRTSSRTGISKTGIRADRVPLWGTGRGGIAAPAAVSALKRQPGVFGGQEMGSIFLTTAKVNRAVVMSSSRSLRCSTDTTQIRPPTCTGVARQKR